MARIKGSPKTGGRKKGTPNKITGCMKSEAWKVFNALQEPDKDGDTTASLVEQARKDPKWFYTVYGARMLPKIVEGNPENPLQVLLTLLKEVDGKGLPKPGG